MNIFKKISMVTKLMKAIDEIKNFFKKTNLSKDVQEVIQEITKAIEKLMKLLPELKEAFDLILSIIKGIFK